MIHSKMVETVPTVLFTAVKDTAITLIVLCNTGEHSDAITMHAVPAGGAVIADNTILKNHAMSGARTFLFNMEKFILRAGDSIVGTTVSGSIVATVSGMTLE